MMAKHEVRSPDGQLFEVEAPDGANEQQVLMFAKKKFAEQRAPEEKKYEGWSDYAADLARTSIGQGAALGFGDEIVAGVKSLVSQQSYDDALKEERDALKRFSFQNPMTSFGATMAGGALLPLGIVRGATTALGTLGRGAMAGAGFGGASGIGMGEGSVENRIAGGLRGAGFGAALGTVIPGAGLAARSGYGRLRDFTRPKVASSMNQPERAADIIMANRMKAANTTPTEVYGGLRAGQESARFHSNSQARLPETLADTSDDFQRLTGTVYRSGGESGNIVRSALEGRQRGPANPFSPKPGEPAGQQADIMDALRRAILGKTKGTASQNHNEIIKKQAIEGNKLYKFAFDNAEPFDIKPALNAFKAKAGEYPKPFRIKLERALNLFSDKKLKINSVKRFNAAKIALDDMIEKAGRSGRSNLQRELVEFKNSMIARVEKHDTSGVPTINKGYHEARKAWGSAAENREAIDLGRSALKQNSEVSIETFKALSPGQKDLFRIGFIDSARNALGRKRPGNDSSLLFQEQRVQDLLREIVPATKNSRGVFSDRGERVGDYLRRQQGMVDTKNKVLGGSPTQQRQMDDARGVGDMLSSAVQTMRGGTNAVLEIVSVGLNKAFGYNQSVSIELAKRLTNSNIAEQRRILARIKMEMGRDKFRVFSQSVSDMLVKSSAAAGVAGAASSRDE